MTVYTIVTLICVNGTCGLSVPPAPVPIFNDYKTCVKESNRIQSLIDKQVTDEKAKIISSCVEFSEKTKI